MAIAGAIALFITLVALGGYFLYRSLPGDGQAATPEGSGTSADAQSDSVEMGAVYIKVIGESSDVIVRVPGGEVLTDTTMGQGEFVSFDHSTLDITIGDPSAVEVYIRGERHDLSDREPGYSFTVEKEL
ncbi:MAG: DUF4115 domain-containing protein [Nocardiopsaceae bacterium]|nr:DUF4115 domain-containing protein [Nocardiopsaceae bacterium]